MDPLLAALMTPGDLPSVDDLIARPTWYRWAACRGLPVAGFFDTESSTIRRAAVAVCSGCAVQRQYLDSALADPDAAGIWAGTTKRERAVMRRQLGMVPKVEPRPVRSRAVRPPRANPVALEDCSPAIAELLKRGRDAA